ncbi:MAG: hypothetical protein WCK67_04790 [bacterium]
MIIKNQEETDDKIFNTSFKNLLDKIMNLAFITGIISSYLYPTYKVNFHIGELYLEKAKKNNEETKINLDNAISHLKKAEEQLEVEEKFNELTELNLYEKIGDTYYEIAKFDTEAKKESEHLKGKLRYNVNLAIMYYDKELDIKKIQENSLKNNKNNTSIIEKRADLFEKQGDAYLLLVTKAFNLDLTICKYNEALKNYFLLIDQLKFNLISQLNFIKKTECLKFSKIKIARIRNKLAHSSIIFITENKNYQDNDRRFESINENLIKAEEEYVKEENFCGYAMTRKLFGDYYKLLATTHEPKKNYTNALKAYNEAKICCENKIKSDCKSNAPLICDRFLKKLTIDSLNENIGNTYLELSKLTSKENNLDEAIKIFKELEQCEIQYGQICEKRAEINSSVEYMLKAINIYLKCRDKLSSSNNTFAEKINLHSVGLEKFSLKFEEIDIEKITIDNDKIQNSNLSQYIEINLLLAKAYLKLATYKDKEINCNKALNIYIMLKKQLIKNNDSDYIEILIGMAKANRFLLESSQSVKNYIDAMSLINSASNLLNKITENNINNSNRKKIIDNKKSTIIEKEKLAIILTYLNCSKEINNIDITNFKRSTITNVNIENFRINAFKDFFEDINHSLQNLESCNNIKDNFDELCEIKFLRVKSLILLLEITCDESKMREINSLLDEMKSKLINNNNFLYLQSQKIEADLFIQKSKIFTLDCSIKLYLIKMAIEKYSEILKKFTISEFPELFAEITNQIGYSFLTEIRLSLKKEHLSTLEIEVLKNKYYSAIQFFDDNLQYYKSNNNIFDHSKTLNYIGEAHVAMAQIIIKAEGILDDYYLNLGFNQLYEALELINKPEYQNTWIFRNIQANIADSYYYTSKICSKYNLVLNNSLIDKSIDIYKCLIDWFDKEFFFVYGTLKQKLGYCYLKKYKLSQKNESKYLDQAKQCYSDANQINDKLSRKYTDHEQFISLNYFNTYINLDEYINENYYYLGYISHRYSSYIAFISNLNEAKDYYKKILEKGIEDNSSHHYANICNSSGDAYNKLFRLTWLIKDFTNALDYYQKALDEYNKEKHLKEWIFINLNIVALYTDKSEIEDSNENLIIAVNKINDVAKSLTTKGLLEKYNFWILSCNIALANYKFEFKNEGEETIKDILNESENFPELLLSGDTKNNYEIKYRLHLANSFRLMALKKIKEKNSKLSLKDRLNFCKKDRRDSTINEYIGKAKLNYEIASKILNEHNKNIEHDDIHKFDILINNALLYLSRYYNNNYLATINNIIEEIKRAYPFLSECPSFELKLKFLEAQLFYEKFFSAKSKDDKQKHVYELRNCCETIKLLLYKNFETIPVAFQIREKILSALSYILDSKINDNFNNKKLRELLKEIIRLSHNEYPSDINRVKKLETILMDGYKYKQNICVLLFNILSV